MKAEQAIQDIRIYLSSIIPDTDGEATSVDLAQRLIEVFFVEGPTIHVKHDIEVLFCFSVKPYFASIELIFASTANGSLSPIGIMIRSSMTCGYK